MTFTILDNFECHILIFKNKDVKIFKCHTWNLNCFILNRSQCVHQTKVLIKYLMYPWTACSCIFTFSVHILMSFEQIEHQQYPYITTYLYVRTKLLAYVLKSNAHITLNRACAFAIVSIVFVIICVFGMISEFWRNKPSISESAQD
jgi:hypothetical protein